MSDKTFMVAGVTKSAKAGYKVRFANDMTRVKILAKTETDIQLIDLPKAMTKPELVAFLKTSELYLKAEYREAIDAADEKYNPAVKASGAKVKAAPSMDALKARAAAKDAA